MLSQLVRWSAFFTIAALTPNLITAQTYAQTLPKPLEGDSLSYTGFYSLGCGSQRLDVNQLNTILAGSHSNTVDNDAWFVDIGYRRPLGKGFTLGAEFRYFFCPTSHTMGDSLNSFTEFKTVLSSYEVGTRFGYYAVQQPYLMILPSIGVTVGYDKIAISSGTVMNISSPANFINQLQAAQRTISQVVYHCNLTVGVEASVKVLSFGINETTFQDAPNSVIKAQHREELWFTGFASFNPTVGVMHENATGFSPSGFMFGIRLSSTICLRYIVP